LSDRINEDYFADESHGLEMMDSKAAIVSLVKLTGRDEELREIVSGATVPNDGTSVQEKKDKLGDIKSKLEIIDECDTGFRDIANIYINDLLWSDPNPQHDSVVALIDGCTAFDVMLDLTDTSRAADLDPDNISDMIDALANPAVLEYVQGVVGQQSVPVTREGDWDTIADQIAAKKLASPEDADKYDQIAALFSPAYLP
jgi:hypothetical protein